MSLVEHLLRTSSGIRQLWRLTISRCAPWWNRLLAYFGLHVREPTNKDAATGAAAQDSDKPPEVPASDNQPRGRPKVTTYKRIPGEWERHKYPLWPEAAFRIPDEVPYGTIYHITKGKNIGFGLTAYVELAPESHVIKTLKTNPYDLREEQDNLANMRDEAEVYRRLQGESCPYVPKLVAWDPDTCCLSIEHMAHGQLEHYVKGRKEPDWEPNPPAIEPSLRRRWALQVTRGLCALHAVGVVHANLTPRNVLLDADMNLRIADFAGSSLDGEGTYKVCAGERYVVPGWQFNRTPVPADDVFLLAGVIYFIMTGHEPHEDVESEYDVAKLYEAGTFPSVEGIEGGAVLQGCWTGRLTTAAAVLDELLEAFGTDEDPLATASTEAGAEA
ncbi:hypothetical protein SCUCBS95973_008567 [Sporothrix curviconia]|uniref:Protein kinase domain-containing protein n=1 Tax=Sporothrix curviconia TaxID=1260050 RepID=A0ABP0CP45_9PEZI